MSISNCSWEFLRLPEQGYEIIPAMTFNSDMRASYNRDWFYRFFTADDELLSSLNEEKSIS